MSLLLTPGPVAVPDFVMQAISRPVIAHRSGEFEEFYAGLLAGLQYLFQTEAAVCTMIGSGTAGVEAAMYSLFRPGEEVLVLSAGKFSQRWVDFGRLSGMQVVPLVKPWGEVIGPEEVIAAVDQHPALRGIVLTHCETSTGALLDLEEIAFAVKRQRPELLLVVDAITTAGALPFYFDDWQLDCAVVASQKALMNPAGLTAFALSDLARQGLQSTHPADYRNLHHYLDFAARHSYPYTPPVQLLYGLQAALDYLKEQSLPVIWNQSHQSARSFRQGLANIGGELFPQQPSDSLTAFTVPGLAPDQLLEHLWRRYKIRLAGGQGALKGKLLRISHMGLAGIPEMNKALKALEELK